MLVGGPESWHPNADFFFRAGGGPMLVVGEQNREMARAFWPQDRGEIVELMTGGAAGLYELPALPRPT